MAAMSETRGCLLMLVFASVAGALAEGFRLIVLEPLAYRLLGTAPQAGTFLKMTASSVVGILLAAGMFYVLDRFSTNARRD